MRTDKPLHGLRIRVVIIAALLGALAGALLTGGTALALEPGVFVDPNSPASKEYSFPLGVLRATAVGRSAPEGASEPLFGVGTRPAATSGGSGGSPTSPRQRSGSSGTPGVSGRSPASPGTGNHTSSSALENLARPRSTTAQITLILLAVVLGGLVLGALLLAGARRRR